MKTTLTFILSFFISVVSFSQISDSLKTDNSGYFSLGGRSTISLFDHDGTGLGIGGQFRIQLSNKVNTDWFADYITINSGNIKSEYYHIGWSVLFYPLEQQHLRLVQPYIVAGHCFDYNKKSEITNSSNSKSRWGSAVQAGIGAHFNLTDRFDISLTSQYMIHFTEGIEAEILPNGTVMFDQHSHTGLEGHLLTTVSFNYKLFKLWNK